MVGFYVIKQFWLGTLHNNDYHIRASNRLYVHCKLIKELVQAHLPFLDALFFFFFSPLKYLRWGKSNFADKWRRGRLKAEQDVVPLNSLLTFMWQPLLDTCFAFCIFLFPLTSYQVPTAGHSPRASHTNAALIDAHASDTRIPSTGTWIVSRFCHCWIALLGASFYNPPWPSFSLIPKDVPCKVKFYLIIFLQRWPTI